MFSTTMPLAMSFPAAVCVQRPLTSSLSNRTNKTSFVSGQQLRLPIEKRAVISATSLDDDQTKSTCADEFVDLEDLGSRRANSVCSTSTERKDGPDSYVALSVAPTPHSKPGYVALSMTPTPHRKPSYVAISVASSPQCKPGYTALSVAPSPSNKSCNLSSPGGGVSGTSRKLSFMALDVLSTPKAAAASPAAFPSQPMFFAIDSMVPMPISESPAQKPLVGSTVISAVGNPITATVQHENSQHVRHPPVQSLGTMPISVHAL